MSRDQEHDEAPLSDCAQLVEYFERGAKPRAGRALGTEHEKFLYVGPERRRITFDGPGGIEDLFGTLAERFGYEPQLDQGRLVALVREGAAISLEPGGQVELSGAVVKTVFETRDEFDRHIAELAEVCGEDVAAVSFGLDPFASLDDITWVPKSRYGIMSRYLATRGDLAHWMMKQTCTIQANLDYTSESDAVDLVATALWISPIVNALFANSSVREGDATGFQSYRAHIWTRTDPDRCGVPPFMVTNDWGFRDWIEWVVDVPLFFIRREGRYIDLSGRSFRDLMHGKIDGFHATMGDFELHLSTVFPEVRMKRFVEVRSADGASREHVFALPALWKGLLYDDAARQAARALFTEQTPDTLDAWMRTTARDGLDGVVSGLRVDDVAGELLRLAREGLNRLAEEAGHPSEAEFLAPLERTLATGESLADELLAALEAGGKGRSALIEARNLFARP